MASICDETHTVHTS